MNLIIPLTKYIRISILSLSRFIFLSHYSSVTQLCLTLCNPMDYSTLGLLVYHQLPEPTQMHVR